MKKGEIWVNKAKATPNAFDPKTWPERVEVKEHLGDVNKGAGGAFIQTHTHTHIRTNTKFKGVNSNLEIPGYNDSNLNGKG